MKLNGDTGARADRFAIKNAVFVKMPIPYPSDNEQRLIGSMLDKTDQLIASNQRNQNSIRNKLPSYIC